VVHAPWRSVERPYTLTVLSLPCLGRQRIIRPCR
jgi:hypothetical protein